MTQQKNNRRTQAVSEVVGEMLMIALVLILAAVFTSQLPNYLPSERSLSVTIMMSNDTSGNVTLWHKGGDWVKVSTLKVNMHDTFNGFSGTWNYQNPDFVFVPDSQESNSSVFDLNGNITIITGAPLDQNTTVILATEQAVLFTGVIGGEQS
jgi:FlaG/FlaF family flagellin (archaellin)